MVKYKWRKITAGIICLMAAFAAGREAYLFGERLWVSKRVVFRIGNQRQHMDYDLACAVNYLKYQFKKAGYHIVGESYFGNIYPKEFDRAGVNVFVRGFSAFFDKRMNEDGVNIFYAHRFTQLFDEEFRGFDSYLTSQQKIMASQQKIMENKDNISFLAGGYVPHPALVAEPVYDVLYIYEYVNSSYTDFLAKYTQAKIFSGMEFAALSDEEREAELKKARLVVYDAEKEARDDDRYVPYAVYDIISYGRPLVTNANSALTDLVDGEVWQVLNVSEMAQRTLWALQISEEERENRGKNARRKLEMRLPEDTSVQEMMQKISQKK